MLYVVLFIGKWGSKSLKFHSNCFLHVDPNKKIEIILQEMQKQLTQMQYDINILKGKKASVTGKGPKIKKVKSRFL